MKIIIAIYFILLYTNNVILNKMKIGNNDCLAINLNKYDIEKPGLIIDSTQITYTILSHTNQNITVSKYNNYFEKNDIVTYSSSYLNMYKCNLYKNTSNSFIYKNFDLTLHKLEEHNFSNYNISSTHIKINFYVNIFIIFILISELINCKNSFKLKIYFIIYIFICLYCFSLIYPQYFIKYIVNNTSYYPTNYLSITGILKSKCKTELRNDIVCYYKHRPDTSFATWKIESKISEYSEVNEIINTVSDINYKTLKHNILILFTTNIYFIFILIMFAYEMYVSKDYIPYLIFIGILLSSMLCIGYSWINLILNLE